MCLMYLIIWASLCMSSTFGTCTLEVKKAIVTDRSGRAHLETYNVFAMMLWKTAAVSLLMGGASSPILKRLSGTAVGPFYVGKFFILVI